MKYTIAKMFQILRHNRWVSILMIIEIALGMSVFTYSLNMFFSLSREKENQKNQERDLVLEISGGEGMNDIEKQAFTLKDYEKSGRDNRWSDFFICCIATVLFL